MNTNAHTTWMTAVACGLVVTACGGGGDSNANNYAITASALSSNGSISPSGNVTVKAGATQVFTITPNAGVSIASVGGTCGGTLNGSTYTSNAINANCTIEAVFSPSIAACFTVPKTVNYALTTYGSASLPLIRTKIQQSVGPITFNNQSVTGSTTTTTSAPDSASPLVQKFSNYWLAASGGVSLFGSSYSKSIGNNSSHTEYVADPPPVIPLNIKSGQAIDLSSSAVIAGEFGTPAKYTFMGFEELILAGKMFSNVCHFQVVGTPADEAHTEDQWYAPDYGEVQSLDYTSGGTFTTQYTGDL